MTQRTEEAFLNLLAELRGTRDLGAACCTLQQLRRESSAMTDQIDRSLLARIAQLEGGCAEMQANLQRARVIHEKLTAPPWIPAVFLRWLPSGQQALVDCGNGRRVVRIADEAHGEQLGAGDEVFLNSELNILVTRAPWGKRVVGETAAFQRRAADGRLVLKWRDQEVLAEPAATLADNLVEGDLVTWDRPTLLVYDRLDRGVSRRHFLAELPAASRADIGGHRQAVDQLIDALTTVFIDPERARKYKVDRKNSILLVGAPGCGKTLMARIAAAEIGRRSGQQCHFAVVQPASWMDPYVGVTERNIREFFWAAREFAGEDKTTVVLMDELESAGRLRGGFGGHHFDRFLTVLLAELDGFVDRGRVAVLGATNRKDMLDPALLERFSEIEIHVGRPDPRAAREIFEIHLDASLPFSPNGNLAAVTRSELIDRAVSRLYAPNADNGLNTIHLRDGKTRSVTARDLISGRRIEQICSVARRSAFLRDVRTEKAGIRAEDIDEAVSDVLDCLATTLTPENARAYLTDLPQDVGVASVETVRQRVRRPHRYLNDVSR